MQEIGTEADFSDPRCQRIDEDARSCARERQHEAPERQGGGLCHAESPGILPCPLRKRRPREREEQHQRARRHAVRPAAREAHDPAFEQEENHRAEREPRQLVGKPKIKDVLNGARRIRLMPKEKSYPIGEDGECDRAERERNCPTERGHGAGDEREESVEGEQHTDAPAARNHRPLAHHRRRRQRVPEIDEAIGGDELREIEPMRRRGDLPIEQAAEVIGWHNAKGAAEEEGADIGPTALRNLRPP